jgi:hypothetical protein
MFIHINIKENLVPVIKRARDSDTDEDTSHLQQDFHMLEQQEVHH